MRRGGKHMKRVLLSLNLFVVILGVLGAGGCGSSKNDGFTADDGGLIGDGSSGDDAGLFGDGGTCRGLHCSSDLHSVIDCDGNVVTACPPDQGCAGTACVAACDSAKANKSTFGCDYFVATPDVILDGAGACFAAFITNTWSTPVTVAIEYGNQTLIPANFGYIPSGSGKAITYTKITNGQIPPGQVAIFFLNRRPGLPSPLKLDCPPGITPAITSSDTAAHGTAMGNAFHIATTAPVVGYDIYPYGGGASAMTSATLLLPTSAWDTNYIAVDAYGTGPLSQPFVQIVGQQDGTTVTISPSSAIVGGTGIPATAKGVPQTYTVNRGQLLQFTQDAPLAGSVIQSNNPVGVWGGKSGLNIGSCCADTGHQQIPPVRALGHEYAGVRYRNRYDGMEEAPPWRIIGAVDGTSLKWDPIAPSGAPTTLALGQVAEFKSQGPFVVKSQDAAHPFYMSAHMTGAAEYDPSQNGMNGPEDGRGDPEFVNVIPPDEFLQQYVFFADPTYPESNLVLVRAKGNKGFQDVTLDCAGVLTGWQPIGTSGSFEYTRFDLVRHNFAPQGNCNNGRHEIHSTAPFGLTVWGWGSAETGSQLSGFYSQYVSYAYPAGAGVQPINTVVVPPSPR